MHSILLRQCPSACLWEYLERPLLRSRGFARVPRHPGFTSTDLWQMVTSFLSGVSLPTLFLALDQATRMGQRERYGKDSILAVPAAVHAVLAPPRVQGQSGG
jgi:hypothetical protein